MTKLLLGDCSVELKNLGTNSLDSLITDPPAGISIFGNEWDSDMGGRKPWVDWLTEVMTECHRILKPGAHGLVWALPKRSHWTALALENAGFRIRDVVSHVYATGFPKSQDLERAILSAKNVDPEKVFQVVTWLRERKEKLGLSNKDLDKAVGIKGGACHWTNNNNLKQACLPTPERWIKLRDLIGPAPKEIEEVIHNQKKEEEEERRKEEAQKWQGWGTELKPAHEHWILVQKEPEFFNLASNLLTHEVGGLNIDDSRILTEDKIPPSKSPKMGCGLWESGGERTYLYKPHAKGRFPANIVLSGEGKSISDQDFKENFKIASRFFKLFEPDPFVLAAKPSKSERGEMNSHPTVKPVKLMEYFCKLLTPTGGFILDPFMGSGTTGVAAIHSGNGFIGIEKEEKYFKIASRRILEATNSSKEGDRDE